MTPETVSKAAPLVARLERLDDVIKSGESSKWRWGLYRKDCGSPFLGPLIEEDIGPTSNPLFIDMVRFVRNRIAGELEALGVAVPEMPQPAPVSETEAQAKKGRFRL